LLQKTNANLKEFLAVENVSLTWKREGLPQYWQSISLHVMMGANVWEKMANEYKLIFVMARRIVLMEAMRSVNATEILTARTEYMSKGFLSQILSLLARAEMKEWGCTNTVMV
jgi:hypothetical protein